MGIDSHSSTCVGTQSPKYLEMAQGHISLSHYRRMQTKLLYSPLMPKATFVRPSLFTWNTFVYTKVKTSWGPLARQAPNTCHRSIYKKTFKLGLVFFKRDPELPRNNRGSPIKLRKINYANWFLVWKITELRKFIFFTF
jgi:hypothetical protein